MRTSPPQATSRTLGADHYRTHRSLRVLVKGEWCLADVAVMADGSLLPSKAGPVPDRLTIWPVDDGRYGLDATFQGGTGYERAQTHRVHLEADGVPHTFRQELDGAWTLRFGPLPGADIAVALAAFVY